MREYSNATWIAARLATELLGFVHHRDDRRFRLFLGRLVAAIGNRRRSYDVGSHCHWLRNAAQVPQEQQPALVRGPLGRTIGRRDLLRQAVVVVVARVSLGRFAQQGAAAAAARSVRTSEMCTGYKSRKMHTLS